MMYIFFVLYFSFPDGESFFMDVSKVFDPKYVFTVYFPIAFALRWALGVQMLGTIIVVEWLNQILKWYFIFICHFICALFNI